MLSTAVWNEQPCPGQGWGAVGGALGWEPGSPCCCPMPGPGIWKDSPGDSARTTSDLPTKNSVYTWHPMNPIMGSVWCPSPSESLEVNIDMFVPILKASTSISAHLSLTWADGGVKHYGRFISGKGTLVYRSNLGQR